LSIANVCMQHKSTFGVHYRTGSPGHLGLRVAGFPGLWVAGSQNVTQFHLRWTATATIQWGSVGSKLTVTCRNGWSWPLSWDHWSWSWSRQWRSWSSDHWSVMCMWWPRPPRPRPRPALVWFGWVEFNAPPDTIEVISEAVFTANHLTDTDKQNSTGRCKQTQYKSEKNRQPKIQQNKTTLVQLPRTTLGQETRWAYSTTPPSPHGAPRPAVSRQRPDHDGPKVVLWRLETKTKTRGQQHWPVFWEREDTGLFIANIARPAEKKVYIVIHALFVYSKLFWELLMKLNVLEQQQ